MRKDAHLTDKRLILGLAASLLLGVGLHDLFQIFPSIITEFIAPVNESIWEHVKLIFYPLLLVEVLLYPKNQRKNGLMSLFIICIGFLAVAWTYHVVLGGRSFVVDIALFICTILLWFWLRSLLEVPDSWMPILRGLLVLFIGLIFAFTLNPPHGTLFNDPTLADAWSVLPC